MAKPMRLLSLLVFLALLGACTPSPLSDRWLPARPLGRDLSTFRPPRISEIEIPEADLVTAQPAKLVEPTGELRLADALSLALMHNPDLSAASYGVRMAEAREIQAGLLPNPEIGVMVERVGGQNELRGVRGAETSLRFSQLIELGDKRTRRIDLARADQRLAAWDYESTRLMLFAQTTKRFVDVLAAQERVTLAQENFKLAEQTLSIIADRVKQGVAAPVERDKATVRLSTERIVLARAQRQLESARHQLAATWGSSTPRFSSVNGELDKPLMLPTLEALSIAASDHPRLARWDDEMVQRRAALELARAKGVPDLTAGAGVMHMNGMDEVVFMGQVMIPLPLFDRNQGAVLEAVYASKAERPNCSARVARVGLPRNKRLTGRIPHPPDRNAPCREGFTRRGPGRLSQREGDVPRRARCAADVR